MTQALLGEPMAKKTRGAPSPGDSQRPRKTTTKVDAELVRKANALASIRGMDLYDLIDSILRGPIEEEYGRKVNE